MEDIETIVTPQTRSYFFNEVDGLAANDGILMVASTNYCTLYSLVDCGTYADENEVERIDPGLAKRPSRFDRKYLFPLPNKVRQLLQSIERLS